MSLLTHLNLNYLRIFLVVYRTRSMTQAAKELHLTQSGVSQQIKSLEETLNITLFDRVNRRIIPTSEAEILYRECSRRLEDLERTLRQISNQDKELRGKIKIGFPAIFGNHTLVPLLSQFAKVHKHISFDLRMGLASELTPLLLEGKLDFAFVDSYATDGHLVHQEVAEQALHLLVHPDLTKGKNFEFNYENCASLPFIAYTENQSILKRWFQTNFSQTPYHLEVRATTSDCNTAALMVADSIGASLLPISVIRQIHRNQPDLLQPPAQKPVKNIISVCYLTKRTMGISSEQCLNWLCARLSESTSSS